MYTFKSCALLLYFSHLQLFLEVPKGQIEPGFALQPGCSEQGCAGTAEQRIRPTMAV